MARAWVWPYILGAFAVFAALSFLCLSAGSVPEVDYGQDVVYLYDWAWRIHSGQITHHDFHTIYGSGFGNLCALFLRLADDDAIAFSWMSVAVTGVCLLLASLLFAGAHAGEPPRYAVVMILAYALLLAFGFGPTHMGMDTISHSALYNRYCFELLLVLFMACFLPFHDQRCLRMANGIAGACLAALLVTKMTFFYVGVLWVALAFLHTRNLAALLTTAAACALLLAGYCLLTGISLREMRADYAVPATLRAGLLFLPDTLRKKLANVWFLPLAVADAGLVLLFLRQRLYGEAILALAIIGCGLLLHLTSNGAADIPLLVFLAVLAVQKLPFKDALSVLAMCLLCLHAGVFIGKNALRLDQALTLARHKEGIPQINAGHIRHLYIEAGRYGKRYVGRESEAADLIRAHVKAPQRIMALDFDNPFNAMLECPPPRHTPLVWEDSYTFDFHNPPAYEQTFSDVSLILVPREEKVSILSLYHEKPARDFVQIAQSARWTLWQRRTDR